MRLEVLTRRNVVTLLLSAALTVNAPAWAQAPAEKLPVVATFSILGDITQRVGGDRIALSTLVGPNGDGHVYSPTPADAKTVAQARVLVSNGLKFEGWMTRLVRSSGTKATVVEAAKGVKARREEEAKHGHSHGHSHGGVDPHAWQDVGNAKIYAANIRDALIAVDPAGREAYTSNAAAYIAELDALDKEIRSVVAAMPTDKRKIITDRKSVV